MSRWVHLMARLYRVLLAFYPSGFRAEFGEEMHDVFADTLAGAKTCSWSHLIILFAHELRDLPGSVWREHLRARKRVQMNQDLAWRPLTTKELTAAMAVFVLPAFGAILALLVQHRSSINPILTPLALALIAVILIVLTIGSVTGFPRWSVPYLGIVVTAIVMLEPSWRVWEVIYPAVYRILGGRPSTLPTRITYQALMGGFSWFAVFVACVLLVLLLAAWPRTRRLAHSIRQDWTLFSFMLYSGTVFALELVFEEYGYASLWKIACWACPALGATIYLGSSSPRKRILALLVGVTLAYWIAAIGKWIILPQQSWGAWYGYDHWTYRRFELGSTIAQWGWVVFFMLIPVLLTRISRPATAGASPEENLIPA